jgi:hypothetical protein
VAADPTQVRPTRKPMPVQAYARTAGMLLFVSFVAGGFGEAYVPSRIVVGSDAAATMQNLRSYEWLLRVGFSAYLIEASCDIALVMLFYALLKPVDRYISLLAAMFGLMGTASFAAAELFFFAPTLLSGGAGYLKAFSPDQLNAIALLSLRLFSVAAGLFMTFYGTGWILRGWLIWRSRYLPKFLGLLMTISGAAFVGRNFQVLLAPQTSASWFAPAMAPGMLGMMAWLLVKGVDDARWRDS